MLLKPLCFWYLSLIFQRAFMLLLIISPMLIAKLENAKRFSRLVGFHLWNREQFPGWPFEIVFLSKKFVAALSMHLRTIHQINTRNTHVAENLPQKSLDGLVYWQEEIILVLEPYLKLDPRSNPVTDSTYHCFDHHSKCSSCSWAIAKT